MKIRHGLQIFLMCFFLSFYSLQFGFHENLDLRENFKFMSIPMVTRNF